ncbi:MAG TPA: aldehyde reductase [Spirochaetia bacterium]|nr:aldehyde reductase [Spirochaetia bacterium]
MSTVLVTGGSGFIGSHAILQLLTAGHAVRTTVRSLRREPEVRALLKAGGAEPGPRLAFFEADLTQDAGWREAVAGCDFVLHVASPFPAGVPKSDDELIVPARDGALRVLRASSKAGVKRVVMTSSFAAVGYGHPPRTTPFTEADWSDPESKETGPYPKSKTIAERAAWDFVSSEGRGLELSVVNPVGVLGPVLGPDFSTSILMIQRFMDGAVPGCPRLWFGLVDVRDVADLHLRAMTDPAARGERFIASAGDAVEMVEIARVLRSRLGSAASRVPTRKVPDFLVRLAALRDPAIRTVLPELGKMKRVSSEKARRLLGWVPRPYEESVVDTARSLLALGLLKNGES